MNKHSFTATMQYMLTLTRWKTLSFLYCYNFSPSWKVIVLFSKLLYRFSNIGNFLVRSAFQTSDQPGTFKCVRVRARCKTCLFICNVEKLSGPRRSIKITDLLYNLHSLQKVIHRRNRETTRRLEEGDKNSSKPVARHFNLPNHSSKQHMAVCGLSLHQVSTESSKTLEPKFIFQIGTINPHGINEPFSFN